MSFETAVRLAVRRVLRMIGAIAGSPVLVEESQMTMVRRLALVVSIAVVGSLALAAAVVAASSGLAPGVYTFTNKDASALFGTLTGPNQQAYSISVDRGLNAFRPRDPRGPRTVANSTIVFLNIFDDAGNSTFGCFLINPAHFTISKDLQTASLRTTLTSDEVCPGFGAPIAGKSDPSGFAGGGGGTALPLPITLDLTWTGLGVISTGTDHSTFSCLDYSTQFTSQFRTSNAKASGTMSAIAGTMSTEQASTSSSDNRAAIKGTPQQACLPF
jgi:hypothetical protein